MDDKFRIEGILSHLPHRYPFILLDRVTDWVVDERLTAIKNVTINEPFFQGHFPGKPIMPGVLMIEAMAQACGMFFCYSNPPAEGKKHQLLLAGVDKARFKRLVTPGDQLQMEVTLLSKKKGVWRMHGEATVDGTLACSADLLCAVQEVDK